MESIIYNIIIHTKRNTIKDCWDSEGFEVRLISRDVHS